MTYRGGIVGGGGGFCRGGRVQREAAAAAAAKSLQSCPTLVRPHRRQPMRFSRQEYWSGVPFPSPGYMYTYS